MPLHESAMKDCSRGLRDPVTAGSPNDSDSPLARSGVRLFLLACLSAAALCLTALRPEVLADRMVLAWILVCFGGEILWFRTPVYDGTLSLAFTLDVAAIACLPADAARCVIAVSTLMAGIYPHRRPWYRVAFNVAQSTLAATAASAVFAALATAGGVAESAHVPVLALASAAFVFYAVNTTLVAIVQAICHRRCPVEVWRDSYAFPLEVASTLGQLSLALFLVLAYRVVGPGSLLGVFPILIPLWLGSRGYVDRAPRAPAPIRLVG